ncbi:MAG: CPBP family intramembrane glutamic endopeptidase [Spirochaetota bacterium]
MVDNNPASRQGWAVPVLVSLAILLPQSASLFQASSTATVVTAAEWLTNGMIQSISQVVLLVVIIGASGRSREFGLDKPRPRDVPTGALIFGGMLLIGRMVTVIVTMLDPAAGGAVAGSRNLPSALPAALSQGASLSPVAALALSTGFSLASAYREELFYRAYLLGSCRQRYAPSAAAIAVSVALFTWSHAYQGPAGMVGSALIGLFLAIAWTRGASVHALAWGHAAYNLGILLTLSQFQKPVIFEIGFAVSRITCE